MPVPTEYYKGLSVLSTPTGTGAQHVETALKELADHSPEVNASATADPTTNDDSAGTGGNGKFHIFSKWINTLVNKVFMCIDATPTTAVWLDITGSGGGAGWDWYPSVLSQIDMTVAEPGAPADGDRYINTTTGVGSVTGQAVTEDYIYEWSDGYAAWVETPVDEGACTLDEALNDIMGYNGTSWVNLGSFADIKDLTDGGNADHLHVHVARMMLGDNLTSQVNGTATLFTCAGPYVATQLEVVVNGQEMVPITDIVETDPAAGTFTTNIGWTLTAPDTLVVRYVRP